VAALDSGVLGVQLAQYRRGGSEVYGCFSRRAQAVHRKRPSCEIGMWCEGTYVSGGGCGVRAALLLLYILMQLCLHMF